jgi:drug/metabolite transporter (DMT)-like permease
MGQRLTALAALVGAMVLVGSSVAVGRLLVAGLPVYFASMVRFALASAVLVPLVFLVEGGWPGVSRRGLAVLFGQALSGSFLFTICLLGGLRLTGATQAGVVAATTPAAVALMGRLIFRERLTGRARLGLLATVAGLVAVEAGNGHTTGPAPVLGNILVLGAVLFEAVFLLLRRALPDPLSPLAAAMWVSLLGLVLFLGPGIGEAVSLDPAALTPAMLATLAYYGLGVTAVAYILWFYGVMRVDAALAGAVTGVIPFPIFIAINNYTGRGS